MTETIYATQQVRVLTGQGWPLGSQAQDGEGAIQPGAEGDWPLVPDS